MKRSTLICALVASWAAYNPVSAFDAESPAIYEIVAGAAVSILPPTIKDYFEPRLPDIEAVAISGMLSVQESDGELGSADAHYLMLDAAVQDPHAEDPLTVMRRFPRDKTEASRLFRRHKLGKGGALPWVLAEHYRLLVGAFQENDEQAIVREAGLLIHLSADAALPFNTTTNRYGESSGTLYWPEKKATPGVRIHRSARHRCQAQLVERCRERLAHEVRVWPKRYRYIPNPLEAAFNVLLDAHADVDTLLAADREAMRSPGITDSAKLLTGLSDYYDSLANRAASVMESRLEAGALLAGNLIGSAWTAAGSPLPRFFKKTVQSPEAPRENDSGDGRLVGSRGSSIFHRPGCPHAKRIGPKNLVSFSGLEEARQSGRRPCKKCAPE